jgi:SNF2 family DNA or RNA helicase
MRIDGGVQNELRTSMIDRFNKSAAVDVMLVSTKAGGTGLNMTGACRVIIYDVNWNPKIDLQALNRAYRIGQVSLHSSFHSIVVQGMCDAVV